MRSDLNHVLLTRFNLPSVGHESLIRAQETWLRDRVGLFERYCLPSVAAQTSKQFSWIIYFDPASPAWLLEWVKIQEKLGLFVPIFREEVPAATLVDDIRTVVGPDRGVDLVTTNLDNDDSLAVDFVARVQGAGVPATPAAIYLGNGLIRRGHELYQRSDEYNAFCSVRASWEAPITCWVDWHNLLPERMPAVVLRGAPGWLQVVHGANVSNRVRGRLTQPLHFRTVFPGLLEDLPSPSTRQVVGDTLLAGPARWLRESGRATTKAGITKVLGKQGLDRFKVAVASARRRFG